MNNSPDKLANKLAEEGVKTLDFFSRLDPGAWHRTVYSEGAAWTVRKILAHFVATERAMQLLVQDILSGGPGSPQDFDINGFNERKVAAFEDNSPGELIEQFREARQDSVDLAKSLREEDLARKGRHPFLGIVSLEDILKLFYRHDGIHLRDIRRVMGSLHDQDQ